MTDPTSRAPRPGGPPAPIRPQFEFRERPSVVSARRPSTVAIASGLWLAAGALVVVAALVMLLQLDVLEAAVRGVVDRGFPQEPQVTRDRVVALTTAVLIGGGVVGLAEAAAALKLRGGRGGARILLVLLLAAAVVEVVLALGVVDLVARLALLLGVACSVVGAVFMYLPAANRWFATRRP